MQFQIYPNTLFKMKKYYLTLQYGSMISAKSTFLSQLRFQPVQSFSTAIRQNLERKKALFYIFDSAGLVCENFRNPLKRQIFLKVKLDQNI